MAWGYRLELMVGREGARVRQEKTPGRACGCSIAKCENFPQYLAAYRYSRANGRAVTASRTLCVKHARLFSMKFSLAWPDMLRRPRRAITGAWAQLAA